MKESVAEDSVVGVIAYASAFVSVSFEAQVRATSAVA